MKRLAIVFGVLCIGIFTMFIESDKKKRKSIYSKNDKDVEFTRPHGEKILVGSSGGRYYVRGDRKIYVKKN